MLTDLEHLGQSVVADGRLVQLRTRLQFSMSQMAELLGVALATYVRWEKHPRTILHLTTAEKVGKIYKRALQEILWLRQDEVQLDNLVPFHRAAARLGWPQEFLLLKYRSGDFAGIDMGILGMWMTMDVYEELILNRRAHVAA